MATSTKLHRVVTTTADLVTHVCTARKDPLIFIYNSNSFKLPSILYLSEIIHLNLSELYGVGGKFIIGHMKIGSNLYTTIYPLNDNIYTDVITLGHKEEELNVTEINSCVRMVPNITYMLRIGDGALKLLQYETIESSNIFDYLFYLVMFMLGFFGAVTTYYYGQTILIYCMTYFQPDKGFTNVMPPMSEAELISREAEATETFT